MTHVVEKWPVDELPELREGEWVTIVCSHSDVDAVGWKFRKGDFEVRDAINVISRESRLAIIGRKTTGDTFSECLIRRGVGALQIDHCRVNALLGEKTGGDGYWRFQEERGWNDNRVPYKTDSFQKDGSKQGRWPPNTVLNHEDGCDRNGTRKVKSGMAYQDNKRVGDTVYGGMHDPNDVGGVATYADEDGNEEIDDWNCVDGCPVAELDQQSGTLSSGWMAPGQKRKDSLGLGGYRNNFPDEATSGGTYGDDGAASRFYPQFQNEDEMMAWLETLLDTGIPQ